MAGVLQRLSHSEYAQAFDAVVLLAALRLSVLWQWLPWLAGFVGIACVDGSIVSIIRSREFLQHSTVGLALCAIGAALLLPATLLLLIIPMDVGPIMLVSAPLLFGILCARAISQLHH